MTCITNAIHPEDSTRRKPLSRDEMQELRDLMTSLQALMGTEGTILEKSPGTLASTYEILNRTKGVKVTITSLHPSTVFPPLKLKDSKGDSSLDTIG